MRGRVLVAQSTERGRYRGRRRVDEVDEGNDRPLDACVDLVIVDSRTSIPRHSLGAVSVFESAVRGWDRDRSGVGRHSSFPTRSTWRSE